MAELAPCYRDASDVERVLRRFEWTHLDIAQDPSGLQTYVTATR